MFCPTSGSRSGQNCEVSGGGATARASAHCRSRWLLPGWGPAMPPAAARSGPTRQPAAAYRHHTCAEGRSGQLEATLLEADEARKAEARAKAQREEAERRAAAEKRAAALLAARERAREGGEPARAGKAAAKQARGPAPALSGKDTAAADWRKCAEGAEGGGAGGREGKEQCADDPEEAMVRRREQERQAGLQRLMSECTQEEEGSGDGWQAAGGARSTTAQEQQQQQAEQQQEQQRQQQQQQRKEWRPPLVLRAAPNARLLAVKRPTKQQKRAPAADSGPAVPNGGADAGDWSSDAPAGQQRRQQQQQQQQQQVGAPKSWAQMAGGGSGDDGDVGGDASELSSMLASLGVGVGDGACEDEQDEALQAAIKASLEEQEAHMAVRVAGTGVAQPAPAPELAPELAGLGLAGLANEAGEYNCFLNVIIQCLWHCVDFRSAVMAWTPEQCTHEPVVAALRELFQQFADQAEAQQLVSMPASLSADSAAAVALPAANGFHSQSALSSPRPPAPGAACSVPASPTQPVTALASSQPGSARTASGGSWADMEADQGAWTLHASKGTTSKRASVVNPAPLREALAALPNAGFQV